MRLVVGLGNPGPEYARTRHNVGCQFIDFVIARPEIFPRAKRVAAAVNGEAWRVGSTVFLKPDTFMNRSGKAVSRTMQHFNIRPERVYVAHDDLDIPLGMTKVSLKGPKTHNGVASVRETIGDTFMKIRIGIENRSPDSRAAGKSYVLQNFTEDEKKALEPVFEKLFAQISRDIL